MKPTYEEMLEGSCQWRKEHLGMNYLLSFHGYQPASEDKLFGEGREGTWCYYLLVPEQMYSHRWEDFKCGRGYGEHGKAFNSIWFDSEITWASSEPYYDHKEEKTWDLSKVGCDYAHLWHMEAGYPDTYNSVNFDAIHSVESLLKEHPDYFIRCRWSGVWDKRENFYECVGGWLVHKDSEVPDDYENWKPKYD